MSEEPLGEHDLRKLIDKIEALHADQLRVVELQRATLSVMDAAAVAPISRLITPTAAEKAAP